MTPIYHKVVDREKAISHFFWLTSFWDNFCCHLHDFFLANRVFLSDCCHISFLNNSSIQKVPSLFYTTTYSKVPNKRTCTISNSKMAIWGHFWGHLRSFLRSFGAIWGHLSQDYKPGIVYVRLLGTLEYIYLWSKYEIIVLSELIKSVHSSTNICKQRQDLSV